MGPDTDDRYIARKNIPYCHNQNMEISCQQPLQRKNSQSMRTQTQELKEHANACPTAMKENIKVGMYPKWIWISLCSQLLRFHLILVLGY